MTARRTRQPSPARRCAFEVIRRVFESGAYADRALASCAASLPSSEHAFAMQLAYGTVQRRATLDHAAAKLVRRPLERLEPAVLAGLRLGLEQLLFLDGVADHAAVNESVELVKGASPGGASLANAVLRRATDERESLLSDLRDDDPRGAATMHSVPEWLALLWWRELGAGRARSLLAHINTPAESAVRANTLVTSREQVIDQLELPTHRASGLPEGIVLEGPFAAFSSQLWREGAIMPQSRSSMLVARVLSPRAGERVLDLCAAPGAKTTHLAALMENRGALSAVERHPGRAQALERTLARMHVHCAEVEVADAAMLPSQWAFDRVLVDPPCSGLGTLQSRPDRRWRATEQGIEEMADAQLSILRAAAAVAQREIVYSVCTISRREGPDVVERFLDSKPGYELEDLGAQHPQFKDENDQRFLQLLPDRDRTDGFFIARLRRT